MFSWNRLKKQLKTSVVWTTQCSEHCIQVRLSQLQINVVEVGVASPVSYCFRKILIGIELIMKRWSIGVNRVGVELAENWYMVGWHLLQKRIVDNW